MDVIPCFHAGRHNGSGRGQPGGAAEGVRGGLERPRLQGGGAREGGGHVHLGEVSGPARAQNPAPVASLDRSTLFCSDQSSRHEGRPHSTSAR